MAERIDSLIEANLRRRGYWEKAMTHMAVAVWSEVVGDTIASQSKALRVQQKVLLVSAQNPGWRHELHMMRREFVKRLNERLGGDYIEDIRMTARSSLFETIGDESTIPAAKRWPGASKLRTVVLPEHASSQIRISVENIKDAELASSLQRFLVTAMRRERYLLDEGLGRCTVCGAPSPKSVCDMCVAEASEDRRQRATLIVAKLPWIDSEGLRSIDPELGQTEIEAARDTVLSLWSKDAQNISRQRTKRALDALRVTLANMTMLLTRTPPEDLTDEMIRDAVGERLFLRAGFGLKKDEKKQVE